MPFVLPTSGLDSGAIKSFPGHLPHFFVNDKALGFVNLSISHLKNITEILS